MAILKSAENIKIKVLNHYDLNVLGHIEKVADKVNIEATHDDLMLVSNKKIFGLGGKTK